MNDVHELYARHAGSLYRYALALSGNAADAEDLVADTFVRLWTAPGAIREATVRAYLLTVLRNLFFTRCRRAGREVPIDEALPDHARTPDLRAAAAIELARVQQHLDLLSDDDRRALLMRGQEGRSYDEIGAALGLSSGAARVRVHRARMHLAKAIGRIQGTTS